MKINASCYEDVEPKNIISKVQNSSFFNFSSKVKIIKLMEKKKVFILYTYYCYINLILYLL